ncbi:hypothetical protein BST81_07580 [Leptolyngbya sp. 'hensonii']|uniref:FHA domain-containing serine/threonine-protein kinase n=1 Tax=Leptolyngbya sp. 'hensonii' TaxID=1922337 RepID=UPI00095021F6|nr:FHA domain-containing serine/threonine-protein kinase [Leptolyngbya sp. 'hensonii']OLP19065.1 hypothetical protein BST81_07580 [Leptolyngbya sp. 'hensonii']
MITLTLLHANHHDVPVQSWTFERESVIRIGRATDNHVVLYSAVVSRHHVELRLSGTSTWEVVSLGTNGTYLDGKRITQAPISDGMIIRLARSGPNIQINLGQNLLQPPVSLVGEVTLGQQRGKKLPENMATSDNLSTPREDRSSLPMEVLQVDPHLPAKDTHTGERQSEEPANDSSLTVQAEEKESAVPLPVIPAPASVVVGQRLSPGQRFSIETGEPLQVKQVIGPYQVLEILGQGGMGITYLAWRDGQSVVLKTLNPEWINHPKALELFDREIKVLQQLTHPGIPRLLDSFSISKQPYLVMEMIHGQNLCQYIETQGAVSQKQAIVWILEVCDILVYLHNQVPPILHRDIKPENLIRRAVPRGDREIAVVDFGAVKFLALEAGTHIGSAGYTAPEQQGGHATSASDLYALGPTLVFLLTGQDPSLFYKYSGQEFRLQVQEIPNLTPEMRMIVETLTEPDPEQRYYSATEVAEALRRIQA